MSAYNSSKKKQLSVLRKRIIDKYYTAQWKEVWFFPSDNEVKGFSGTQNIIFLGLNPSMGHFPSKADKLLYEQLKKNGFQNAHLTDFIKTRLPNKKNNKLEDSLDFKEQCSFLEKEIRIISPKMIVFLGEKVQRLFLFKLKDRYPDITTDKIPHYAYRWAKRNKFKAKFSREMKRIKNRYKIILKD